LTAKSNFERQGTNLWVANINAGFKGKVFVVDLTAL
jgi:hypothetical protein